MSIPGWAEGYEASAVIDSINQGKERVTSALRARNFAGLRAYVNEFYPIASTATLSINSGGLVTRSSKEAAFSNADGFLSKLLGVLSPSPGVTINLSLSSEPTTARVEIWADGGDRLESTTNSQLQNVYRGWYQYSVTKAGFKVITGRINLVDANGTSFRCTLNRSSEPEGPVPCTLQ